ncbi:MAG: hypothetical protein KKD39_08440 [Candidatus Altiarchaeota archaeon]|nr:hypothetical protein [Candidatus Altiarchaeota archaeon]
MFDGMYEKLTSRVDYRLLAILTPLFAVLMVVLLLFNGIEYGIDFKGGMWIEVLADKELNAAQLQSLEKELSSKGLENVKVTIGYDLNTGYNKLVIQTTTVLEDKHLITDILSSYAGRLTEYDTAETIVSVKPPTGLEEKLEQRLKYDIDYNYADGKITIYGMDLAKEDLDSALSYYLNEKTEVSLSKKNFNIRSVGPTLGATFREQGIKAIIISFVLMSIVVFIAFKEIIPCVAVIQAAVCDIVIALGGMSLLGIPLEPATIGALLMLIGYSVDTDIMLTSRTIKDRRGEFNEQVEDAIKTGLTMTGTTLAALSVIYVISTALTQIETWAHIASVLIIGLFGDLPATWFTNVGIIKWYVESGKRKITRWKK